MKQIKYTNIFFKALVLALAVTIISSSLVSCTKCVTDGAKSSKDDLRVVGTIGGYEVCYDEYRYVVLSCRDILKQRYGDDIWGTPENIEKYTAELEEMVSERITANYAVLTLCDAYGYEKALYDKKAVEYVNDQIDKAIYLCAVEAGLDVEVKQKGEDDVVYKYGFGEFKKAKELYLNALSQFYVTERIIRLTLGTEYAFSQLSGILTSDKKEIIHTAEDIEAFMNGDDFICTRHVLIEKSDSESREETLARANEVYELYLNGKSMDYLIGSKYNMDITMPYAGYYFTHGEMDEEYEKVAFELAEGEVSAPVETDSGFFIIQRYFKDEEYMSTNLEDFAQQIIYSLVNKKVRAHQETLTLEKNEFGASLNLHEIS